MNTAITGGAGFIGSHLVDRLMADGHRVLVLDNLAGGRLEFLEQHRNSSRFRFVKLDIRDTEALKDALDPSIDVLYHLAANADISRGVEDPTLDFEHSIVATFSVLQAMRHHRIGQIVYTSGSGVYGDRRNAYSDETFGPLKPVSVYGATKLAAEGLISAFAYLFDFRAWIARPANIIGPRSTHGVLFDFIGRLRRDPTQLLILGDGNQSKAYLHVSDVIDALMLIHVRGTDRVNHYNISAESYMTVNEIASLVIEVMDLDKVQICHTGGTAGWKGDVPVARIDGSAIRALGWIPRFNCEAAVHETIVALMSDPRLEPRVIAGTP